MKKITLLLIFVLCTFGCSLNNDNNYNYEYKVLPILSYELPQELKLGETYEIKLKYQKPTQCYSYQGIYYSKSLNTRIIGIQSAVQSSLPCAEVIPEESEVSFIFYVTSTGSYVFKFYKGLDADGKDIFEDVEVPVVI